MYTKINVSIILPSLNVFPFIRECLDSVVNQNMDGMEIICVDAGSTDGTLDVIREYEKKDDRIHIILSPVKSYGYQLNMGFVEARGDYVGVVETDDIIEKKAVENLYNSAVQNGFPDYVKGKINNFADINGQRHVWLRPYLVPAENIRIDLCSNRSAVFQNYGSVFGGLYKKSFLEEKCIFFNETPGAAYQDIGFLTLLAVYAESAVYISESVYNYRFDNEGSSVRQQRLFSAVIDEFTYIDSRLKEDLKLSEESKKFIMEEQIRAYHWNYTRLSDKTYRTMFMNEAKSDLLKIKNAPEYKYLSKRERERAELMLSDGYEEYVSRKARVRKNALRLFEEDKRYIIVSAGEICERIIFLQEINNEKYVRAVCDNSRHKQGTLIKGFEIISVEKAVSLYKDNCTVWIVANMYYAEDILKQLDSLGIESNRIITVLDFPNQMELIEEMGKQQG